jgi:phage N-6-adenine-methyltransferase
MPSHPIDRGDKTPKRRAISGHFNIALSKDEWITPKWIIDALTREIPFDLDPFAHPAQPWPTALEMWAPPRDGLAEEWPRDKRKWVNPPFSRIAACMAKLADHHADGGSGTAICLAGLETRWFVESVWRRATAMLVLYKRPHFYAPDGRRAPYNCGKGCTLVAYGEPDASILRGCGLPGRFLWLADTVELPSDPCRGGARDLAGAALLQLLRDERRAA